MDNPNDILSQLDAAGLTSLTAPLRAQRTETINTRRRAAHEQRVAAERDEAKRLPVLENAKAQASAEFEAARDTLSRAAAKCADAEQRFLVAHSAIRQRMTEALDALRANVPAAIIDARQELDDAEALLRAETFTHEYDEVDPTKQRRLVRTNQQTNADRRDAIARARVRLDELIETYLESDGLARTIAELLASIPHGLVGASPIEPVRKPSIRKAA